MANGILKKVQELQKRVAQFKKDKTNPHFRYGYASAEGVNDVVKAVLVELGIVAQLSVRPAANLGNVMIATAELTLIDPEDGSSLSFSSIGSGTDSGDKAAMKAATAASKYATIAAVFGASADDPEADAKTDAPKASTVPGTTSKPAPAKASEAAPAEGEHIGIRVEGAVKPLPRVGMQPFKVETEQGVFQNFDKKIVDQVVSGVIVIYKKSRFGLDIVEVVGPDAPSEAQANG